MLLFTGPTESLFCLDDEGMGCDSKSTVHRYLGKQELGSLCTLATNSTADFGQNTFSLYLRSLMTEGFAVVLQN